MSNIGISEIGVYLPDLIVSNYDRKEEFGIDDTFIEEKIGIRSVTRKTPDENTSDLCVKAFQNLVKKRNIDPDTIDIAIVVTQNPDFNLPHTAAIVHKKLALPERVATFDVALGCSGFVYGLATIESFMKTHGMTNGLLFTADPYSKIINPEDKNTSLLFGDGATVSLISTDPVYTSGQFTFGTIGNDYDKLICSGGLSMNGRSIFNFAARYVPIDVESLLSKNSEERDDIDLFIFHQGSKYICDTIIRRVKLNPDKVPFDATHYGNTVSSSIPIILEKYGWGEGEKTLNKVLISGFGVGLSWAGAILYRT